MAAWLRGGVTRVMSITDFETTDPNTNIALTETRTLGSWNIAVGPQLVFSPVPHVGITLGVSLDVGVSGEKEMIAGTSTITNDASMSSYGVTSGLVALF